MENRVDRKSDESVYQPKIHRDRIRVLYGLKLHTGMPMTVLVDKAIRDLAEHYDYQLPGEDQVEVPPETETWDELCEYVDFLNNLDLLEYMTKLGIACSNEPRRDTDQ
jgi:hypothetical protein